MNPLIDTLNAAQQQAVTAAIGNTLVLAGAGSGKTRVLTHRIAWLIQHHHVSPNSILSVTFTNKAAAEMRSRLDIIIGSAAQSLWVGTFHSIAHRLLRLHWKEAHLPVSFQILDSDDQLRLIKRILKDLNIDDTRCPPNQAQWFINTQKDEGRRAKNIEPSPDPIQNMLSRVYQTYENRCEQSGLVDFGEILLRVHELWQSNATLLERYRERFHHVLVDEFQDTNAIQYAWIRSLVGQTGNIMAVGDDDQSIYGWRGAKIANIQRFNKDFQNTQTIRLEQNYRSTGNILAAANAVIGHNQNRLGKTLWTDSSQGEKISLYTAFNDLDEARFIVDRIKMWLAAGHAHNTVALLYRSNAQSRVLEENLMNAGIPYRVYGGQRFFDRAEIRDVLAYLRLMLNRHDDAAFERIINTPTRGIGNTTLAELRIMAREQELSLWQTTLNTIASKQLSSRAESALAQFVELINHMANTTQHLELHEQTDYAIRHSGLLDHFKKEKGEKGLARIENIEELVSATRDFVPEELEDMSVSPLASFIAHTALETNSGQAEKFEDSIQLMTLHSAKGLEFPLVFLCGVEEGLFPHKMSMNSHGGLEEERRLCYVGMTRAMKKLFITHAECRRLHGSESYQAASRFIREIPKELIDVVRMENTIAYPIKKTHYTESPKSYSKEFVAKRMPALPPKQADLPFPIGARAHHPKFGEGIIMTYEGDDANLCVHVKFQRHGLKRLILQYANLVMG